MRMALVFTTLLLTFFSAPAWSILGLIDGIEGELSGGGATSSGSGDGKTYPGSGCQAVTPSGHQAIRRYGGRLYNYANHAVTVSCPVVKDTYQSIYGTKSVLVRGGNPGGGSVRCVLYSASPTATWSNARSTSATGYFGLGLDVNSSAKDSAYRIECSLPPAANVMNYGVVEH